MKVKNQLEKCRLHRAACLGLGGRTLLMDIYPRSKYELRRTSPLITHLHISQNSNELLTHLALAVGGRTGFGRESKASAEVATIFCDLFPHFFILLYLDNNREAAGLFTLRQRQKGSMRKNRRD